MTLVSFDDALKHFGSRNKIALELGIRRQAITPWSKTGIPAKRQFELHELMKANGQAKGKTRD